MAPPERIARIVRSIVAAGNTAETGRLVAGGAVVELAAGRPVWWGVAEPGGRPVEVDYHALAAAILAAGVEEMTFVPGVVGHRLTAAMPSAAELAQHVLNAAELLEPGAEEAEAGPAGPPPAGGCRALPPLPPGEVVIEEPMSERVDLEAWAKLLGTGVISLRGGEVEGFMVVEGRMVIDAIALRGGDVVWGDQATAFLFGCGSGVASAVALPASSAAVARSLWHLPTVVDSLDLRCVNVPGFAQLAAELGATMLFEAWLDDGTVGAVCIADGTPSFATVGGEPADPGSVLGLWATARGRLTVRGPAAEAAANRPAAPIPSPTPAPTPAGPPAKAPDLPPPPADGDPAPVPAAEPERVSAHADIPLAAGPPLASIAPTPGPTVPPLEGAPVIGDDEEYSPAFDAPSLLSEDAGAEAGSRSHFDVQPPTGRAPEPAFATARPPVTRPPSTPSLDPQPGRPARGRSRPIWEDGAREPAPEAPIPGFDELRSRLVAIVVEAMGPRYSGPVRAALEAASPIADELGAVVDSIAQMFPAPATREMVKRTQVALRAEISAALGAGAA